MNIIGWIVAIIVVTIIAPLLNLQWLVYILAFIGIVCHLAGIGPSKEDGVNNNTTEQNHANGNNRSDGKENLGGEARPETGKKKKIPVKIMTVYIVVNFGSETVRLHAYRHKSNNYDVRFSDSRDKELGRRGAKSRGYDLQEMIAQIERWGINPEIVGQAIVTLDGKSVA